MNPSAGTSVVRTTSASKSTPSAIAKPISVSIVIGIDASTRNVPASTTPAEVITPPVTINPRRMPSRGPCSDDFFAHTRHQEDVVVDAERDQEYEHE